MNTGQTCQALPRAADSVSDSEARYLLLGRIADEVKAALQAGDRPDVAEWTAEHPHLAAEIHELVETLGLIHCLGSAGSESGETVEPPALLRDGSTRLGDFRLVREIGRGGMGIVYEAEQISLGRRVALKVLPLASMLDPARLRRFRNEALAAAQLEHPHIVDVYGVGCEQGVHFYVMRYIEGWTLAELIESLRTEAPPSSGATTPLGAASTSLVARSKGDVGSVARIGIQVAEALEHAHGQGVIHRDIKPSNLIVDAQGDVSVCDFGLAQIGTDATLTATGDVLGTLRYMSPEQALGRRGLVDHRTDIYSLGITLYELLTLEPAHRGEQREELLRCLATDEPLAPRRLNRRVPADLETIVLKSIAKEPADRYASAGELAADLRRFLESKPICARRPSLADRGSKWLRRHRGLSLAAFAALLLSVAGLVLHTWRISAEQAETRAALDREARQGTLAAQRAREAETARDEALRAAEESRAVQRFLTHSLLLHATPQKSLGRDLTVRELLNTADRRIEGAFPDQPSVEAAIRHALGLAWDQLGEYEAAERHLRKAAEIREARLGPGHSETLRTLTVLEAVLIRQDRIDEAEPLNERVYSARRRILGDEHPRTLQSAHNRAVILSRQGRFEAAARQYRQILAIQERTLGKEHAATLLTRENVAALHQNRGEWDAALEMLEQILADRRRALGETHPDTLRTRTKIVNALRLRGATAAALGEVQQLLGTQRRVLGAEHPETLDSQHELAELLEGSHCLSEALDVHRQVLEGRQRVLGPDHRSTLNTMRKTGILLFKLGRIEESRPLLEACLNSLQRTLGTEHPDTLGALASLARVVRAQGQSLRALEIYRQASDGFEKHFGSEHPSSLDARSNMANCLCDLQRFDEARVELEPVVDALVRTIGPDHPETLMSSFNLAAVLECVNQIDRACRLHEDVFDRRLQVLGIRHPETLRSLRTVTRLLQARDQPDRAREILARFERLRRHAAAQPVAAPRPDTRDRYQDEGQIRRPQTLSTTTNLGTDLAMRGRYAEARVDLEAALEARRRVLGPEHRDTLSTGMQLAAVLRAQGDSAAALELHRQALDGFHRQLGPDHHLTLAARNNVANCLVDARRFDEALRMYEEVLAAKRRVYGPDHPRTLLTSFNLARACEQSGHLEEACVHFKDVFNRRLRRLGVHHRDTQLTLRRLLHVLQATGEAEQAREILTRFEQHRREAAAQAVAAPRPDTSHR